jgi:hypothetical protein
MYKFIDFLFGSFVKTTVYGNKLNNSEFSNSQLYLAIFIFFYAFIIITLGACDFVIVNLGIIFNKIGSTCIALFISTLVAGIITYQAKQKNFVENKVAAVEPKSEKEMKKYVKYTMLTKIIPICFYPLILMFICYLLQVFVFHR